MVLRRPGSTLFPYTTLFRSKVLESPSAAWAPICMRTDAAPFDDRSEEHTSELQSHLNLVCRLLLEKKNCTLKTQDPEPSRASTTNRHGSLDRDQLCRTTFIP